MNVNSFYTIPEDIHYCYEYAKHRISGDMPNQQQGDGYALCGHVRLLSACGILLTIGQFAVALLTGQMTQRNFFNSAVFCVLLHDTYAMSNNFINYHSSFIDEYNKEIKLREINKKFWANFYKDESCIESSVDKSVSDELALKVIDKVLESTILTALKNGALAFADFIG